MDGSSSVSVRYVFLKNGKRGKGIYYVLSRGDGTYIRRRWWGGIQTTVNRQLATVFDDVGIAEEWAKKRGLIQQ